MMYRALLALPAIIMVVLIGMALVTIREPSERVLNATAKGFQAAASLINRTADFVIRALDESEIIFDNTCAKASESRRVEERRSKCILGL